MGTPSAKRAAITRRRRSVALAILVAIALVVTFMLWRPWEPVGAFVDAVAPTSTPVPAESTEPESTEASPTETDPAGTSTEPPYTPVGGVPEGGVCSQEDVEITALTDATTYAAGQEVSLSFRIENVSDAVCTINVGTTQQQYVVSTGQQRVYDSTDCVVDAVDQIVDLQPGVAQETIPIVWNRTFSSPDACASPGEAVVAGGASYHLNVTVSGIAASDSVQFLLY